MAKKVKGEIRLQIPAGQANPAPPVGPALGAQGVNIMDFCKAFNAETQGQPGMVIPVVITVFEDRSFTFVTKSPPAPILIKKAAGLASGHQKPGSGFVGKVTVAQLKEIAEVKKNDLKVNSEEAAIRLLSGTARSMGVEVVDEA